jgi:multimeric flavodoxin WrbA
MNIFAMLGSRNPQGQTAQAAEAFLAGARAEGAGVERVFLPACRIERCRQCDERGWGLCRTEGRCVIGDDFAALTETLRRADLAVFATPVYFSDLSESLRAYLDRLRRILRPESARPGFAGKPAVGIAVAGGGGGGAPACIRSLEKILQHCFLDSVELVPVRRQNLALKCRQLEAAGRWLAGQKPPG